MALNGGASGVGDPNLLAMLQHEYELYARINAHAAVNARCVTLPDPATFAAAAAAIAEKEAAALNPQGQRGGGGRRFNK